MNQRGTDLGHGRTDRIPGLGGPNITTTDWRIRWLTVLVQLRISDRGKIAAALC